MTSTMLRLVLTPFFSTALAVIGCGGQPPGSSLEPISAQTPEAAPRIEQKIIYHGTLQIVVKDFSPVPEKITKLAEKFGGYVASSDQQGTSGSSRGGNWKLRVPSAKYEPFLAAAREIGQVTRENTTSEDVTAEFYDIEARMANKRREEERLIKHLQESTGKLDEILLVERELSRVRGEIEQMEGRLRLLRDQTTYSTVTLIVTENQSYIAPTPFVPTTFRERIALVWNESLAGLLNVVQCLFLFAVAVTPWLLVLALPAAWLWRKMRRRPVSASLA